MHLSIEELSEHLSVPTQRINNLLNMAGLLNKVVNPQPRWEVSSLGIKYCERGKWSCEIIPLLEDQIDRQEERNSVRITQVDTDMCEQCGQVKPYYEFSDSRKRPGDLTKWCKECQRRYGGWI